jgi:hypothetical protein
MRKYVRGFIVVMMVTFSISLSASRSERGGIRLIHAMKNGAVIFYHDGVRSNDIPGCGQGYANRWVINSTYPGGNSQISVLLTAQAQGKKIRVVGTNGCDIWGDTETVGYIVVLD